MSKIKEKIDICWNLEKDWLFFEERPTIIT